MQAGFKDAQNTYGASVAEISLLRTVCSVLISLPVLALCGHNPLKSVERDLAGLLVIRCLSGALAFILVITAVKLIPLTIFQIITQVTPFTSGVLACIWVGDKLSVVQIICMVICFCGIALVTFSKDSSEVDAT